MYFKGAGIIGDAGMKPTITWDWKERRNRQTGQMERKRVPFIRFSMLCEDQTQRPEPNPVSGRMQRPREIVQVILPENERGLKLFQSLSPGRLIYIEGRQTHKPSVGKNGQGEQVLYANTKVYMSELMFMDSPPDKQVERLVGMMVTSELEINGQKITEEVGETISKHVIAHLASLREQHGPPREIIDKTKIASQDDAPATNQQQESSDPDKADFAQ